MWKKISLIIDILLILVIGFLGYVQIAMLVSKKNNHGVPQVFGQSILYVATDSMDDPDNKNSLSPGTGIIISKVKPQSIKPSTVYYEDDGVTIKEVLKDGDIVTFYWADIDAPDTHRVIKVDYDETVGKYKFTTMGDNPIAHKNKKTETWYEDDLIGKVTSHSKALGTFLEISSPEAAAYLSARTKKQHFAWFFPVAILTPIVIIAGTYIVKTYLQYEKERKARDAEIQTALEASGIDLNDEEACELFRMKEEMRLDIKEQVEKEYQKAKAKIAKEMKKKKDEEKN